MGEQWMRRILNSSKFRVYCAVILIVVFFGGLLLAFQLHKQLALPSKGWSRAISMPLHIKGEYAPSSFMVQKEGKQYHFYTYRKGGITDLTLDPALNVSNVSRIPFNLKTDTPFWAKKRTVLALIDHKLILYKNGKKETLTTGVAGMAAVPDQVIFWKKQHLYQVNLHTFVFRPLGSINGKIETVILKPGQVDFLVIQRINDTTVRPYLFQKQRTVPLAPIKGESIAGFDFALSGHQLHLIYSVTKAGHGGLTTKDYVAAVNLKTSTEQITDATHMYGRSPGDKIDVEDVNHIGIRNGKPILLLSGKGQLPNGGQAENIYIAKKRNGSWTATPISATNEPSQHPFWLNQHTVMWFDFVSYGDWVLNGASQNQQVIAKSEHLNGHDWAFGASDAVMGLVGAFFLLIFAFLWAVPAALFYGFMMIRYTKLTEDEPAWIKFVTAGLFFVTQIIFIQNIFNGSFASLAPSYLRFPLFQYVIPIILLLLSWGILKIVRDKEWGNFQQLSLWIGADVLIMMLLVGPYMI